MHPWWKRVILFGVACIRQYKFKMITLKMILAVAIAMSTEFVADEYWQSTEVAHKMHFRKGHLTWEWLTGIRSYIIPLIVTGLYQIGSVVWLDSSSDYLMLAPQLVQVLLTAVGHACFFLYARAKVGPKAAGRANFLSIINWFTTYCGARLISNQTEMSLNSICLWLLETNRIVLLTFTLGINFLIRPTAVVFWIPFIPEIVKKIFQRKFFLGAFTCGITAIFTLTAGFVIDTRLYNKPTFSWWQFFMFNFVEGGSAEFGVHHPLWYFYSGLPSIFGPLIILLPTGFFVRNNHARKLSYYIAFYVAVFSCVAHKEIRFLLPVLPITFIVLGTVLVEFFSWERNDGRRTCFPAVTAIALVYLNLMATIFFGLYHQYGVKSASKFILNNIQEVDNPKVWIMMPCYSVPPYTYIHHPTVEFEFYICVPDKFSSLYREEDIHTPLIQPEGFEEVDLYVDFTTRIEAKGAPDLIMAHDLAVDTLENAALDMNLSYSQCGKFRHTFVGEFARFIIVMCKDP